MSISAIQQKYKIKTRIKIRKLPVRFEFYQEFAVRIDAVSINNSEILANRFKLLVFCVNKFINETINCDSRYQIIKLDPHQGNVKLIDYVRKIRKDYKNRIYSQIGIILLHRDMMDVEKP